jgi:hypothetical protein
MVSPWMENGVLPDYLKQHPFLDHCQIVSLCLAMPHILERDFVLSLYKWLKVWHIYTIAMW